MIYTLKSVSKKIRKNNKPIIASCVCSVAVAIIIILSIFNLTFNAKSSYIQSVRQEFGDFDYIVGENEVVISDDIIDQINGIPGISESTKICVKYIPYNNISVYAAGVEDGPQSQSYYKYKHNLEHGDVIINKSFASYLQKEVGDYIVINNNQYIIREIISESKNVIAEVNMAIFTEEDLRIGQELSGCNYMLIKLSDNTNQSKFLEEYHKTATYSITGLLDNDKIIENLQVTLYIVRVMLGIVIITSAFLLTTIFQRFYKKYSRDFSTIRSLGGSQKQAVGIIKNQINFVIVMGIFIGLMLTIFLNHFILNGLSKYIQLSLNENKLPWKQDLLITLIFGFILRTVFALFNYKNNKIMPTKIGKEKNYSKSARKYIFITIMGFSFSGFFFYEALRTSDIESCVYSIVILLGTCYFCSPLYIDLCLRLFKIGADRIKWRLGKISIDLIKSHIRKNTLVVLAISSMIFLLLVGNQFVKITNQISINHYRDAYITDFIISENHCLDYHEAMKLYDIIGEIDSTDAFLVSTQNIGQIGQNQYITYSFGDITQMKKMNFIKADTDDFSGKCILDADYAKRNGFKTGDKINFNFSVSTSEGPESRIEMAKSLKIESVVEDLSPIAGDALIDLSNEDILQAGLFAHFLDAAGQGVIYLNGEPEIVSKELEQIKSFEIGLQWSSFQDVKNNITETSEQRWKIFSIVLYFVGVVAACGIINTIQMGINSKRKEYALLRTMRMKPDEISSVIMIQTMLFILIGGILGIVLGYVILNMVLLTEIGYISININSAWLGILVLMAVSVMSLKGYVKKISNAAIVDELKR